jgi:hypothetical protein
MRKNDIYSKQIIFQSAHFQDLTRNDWETTENEQKIWSMTVIDKYHLFSFATHERLFNGIF